MKVTCSPFFSVQHPLLDTKHSEQLPVHNLAPSLADVEPSGKIGCEVGKL